LEEVELPFSAEASCQTLRPWAVNLRQGTTIKRHQSSAPYGAGTRVGVHRSRYELERILGRYGASDFAVVEADANASIQFALEGRYIQLALPLPDPDDEHFKLTRTGRQRTVVAQERAYEQALREHWRALVLAVRGKLQSVESGISTFDAEFAGFLVPHALEERNGRKKKKPRAVNWLLGSSHSLAIAMVAAFLVPASAVSAFALPPSIVDQLSAPFRGALPAQATASSDGTRTRTVALSSRGWARGETDTSGDVFAGVSSKPSKSFDEVVGEVPADSNAPESSPPTSEVVTASEPIAEAPPTGSSQSIAATSGGGGEQSSSAANSGGQSSGGSASSGQGRSSSGGGSSWEPVGGGSGAGDEPGPDTGDGGSTGGSEPGGNPDTPAPDTGKGKEKENGKDNGKKNGADNGNGAAAAENKDKQKGKDKEKGTATPSTTTTTTTATTTPTATTPTTTTTSTTSTTTTTTSSSSSAPGNSGNASANGNGNGNGNGADNGNKSSDKNKSEEKKAPKGKGQAGQ
jgi:hypothetical protein